MSHPTKTENKISDGVQNTFSTLTDILIINNLKSKTELSTNLTTFQTDHYKVSATIAKSEIKTLEPTRTIQKILFKAKL